jgi:hypothetical protein
MKRLLSDAFLLNLISFQVQGTLVSITNCTGANSCDITTNPPDPILADLDNGQGNKQSGFAGVCLYNLRQQFIY